jgi:hypothetical protein
MISHLINTLAILKSLKTKNRSPQHHYNCGIVKIRPLDPAIAISTNVGPWDDTLITGLAVFQFVNFMF